MDRVVVRGREQFGACGLPSDGPLQEMCLCCVRGEERKRERDSDREYVEDEKKLKRQKRVTDQSIRGCSNLLSE